MNWFTEVRWSPYAVGIGIGVLSWLTFLISKKPIGCSTSFARMAGMIESLFRGKRVEEKDYFQETQIAVDWQFMLVFGVVVGAFVSATLSGDFRWQWIPSQWVIAFGSDRALRLLVSLLGGIVLGFGSRWAGGCTSGHGISGTMQLALSSWISTVCFFIGGILMANLLFSGIG